MNMPEMISRRAPKTVSLALLVAFVVVVSLQTAPLQGQVFQLAGIGDRMEDQMKMAMEQQKESAERRMTLHVKDLERSCELSEDQVKKLKIAAKGAVLKMIKDMEKKQERQMQMFGNMMGGPVNDFEADDEDEADEDVDEDFDAEDLEDEDGEDENVADNFAVGGFNINVAMAGGLSGEFGGGGKPEDQEVWKNAVEKTLTADQQEKYQQVVAERKAFVRDLSVERFIAQVDRKLLLSVDQRNQLLPLIDEHFGEDLAKQEMQSDGMMEGAFFINAMGMMGNAIVTEAPIDRKLIEPILDEDQMTEWKKTFEPQLNQLANSSDGNGAAMMWGGGMAAPVEAGMDEEFEEDEN